MISILSRVGVSARRMHAAASIYAAGNQEETPDLPKRFPTDARWQTIHDQFQIEHVLRHILETKREVTLTCSNGQRMARTQIVAIDGTLGGHLLIERTATCSFDEALPINRQVNLVSRFLGLPVLCPVDVSQTVLVEGKPCYRSPLPSWLMFSEMRDSQRVRSPKGELASLTLNVPGHAPLQANVIDISEYGIGFHLPKSSSYIPAVGEHLEMVTLRSGNGESIALELELRQVSRHGIEGYRIGAKTTPVKLVDQEQLQRLIVQHQFLFADMN